MIYRQVHLPARDIPCARHPGDPLKPAREHEGHFRSEWTSTLRAISRQCPNAASECTRLLALDPLDARNDAAINATIARIRQLCDPRTVRTMQREKERYAFGATLRRLRMERGLSLWGLAAACRDAARLLRFRTHSSEHYQIVQYEAGRLGAHYRTVMVLASALGVAVDQIYG